MTVRTVLTMAALTVQEASRRRVLRALAGSGIFAEDGGAASP
jgi:hypothetical protein